MDNEFKQTEAVYQELREKYRKGEISRQEFLDEMKNLQVKDDEGRLWMIGSQSGKWYFLKGQEWVQAEPEIKKTPEGACPYCGFENKSGAEACARCGGGLQGAEDFCIECGEKLQPPLFRCPKCDAPQPGATPASTPTPSGLPQKAASPAGESVSIPPTAPAPFRTSAPPPATSPAPSPVPAPARVPSPAPYEKKPVPLQEKRPVQGDFLVKAVSPASFAFFGGALGIILGIILGAFIGATDLLAAQAAKLPGFLADMQGTLIGAVVYAAAGGIIGFLALGLLGWLKALFLNLLLSFVGGIRVRLDQAPEKAAPNKRRVPLV
jgi:hypothetical protein